ncbi:hypothetical protein GCM10027200_46410 [Lentzea nigeriaca]
MAQLLSPLVVGLAALLCVLAPFGSQDGCAIGDSVGHPLHVVGVVAVASALRDQLRHWYGSGDVRHGETPPTRLEEQLFARLLLRQGSTGRHLERDAVVP